MNEKRTELLFDLTSRTSWTGAMQSRRRRYRRMISIAHHVTFRLGRWFPNMFPLVYVLGFPKSGTSWVAQLVSDVLRLPFPQHAALPVGCPAVVHGHDVIDRSFPTAIYTIRDGRDVTVSAFHHAKSQFEAGGGSRRYKSFFKSLDLDKPVADNLPAFIQFFAKHPIATRSNWGDHVKSFFETNNPNVTLIQYESLLADTEATLAGAIKQLAGSPPEESRVQETVARFAFQNQLGTKAKNSYLRSGKKNDWINHFSRETAELFDQHFGEALILAGYEENRDWVDLVQ